MIHQKIILKPIAKCTFLGTGLLFASCNQLTKPKDLDIGLKEHLAAKTEMTISNTLQANITTEFDPNIRSIFQDKSGNYWFGTNGSGVYRYDGETLLQFTDKDGLSNNQVQSIQEDQFGTIWLGTGLFSVSRFNGQTFTTYTNHLDNDDREWKTKPDDLWFYAGAGAYRFNNSAFVYLPLAKTVAEAKKSQDSPYNLSPNAVYSILKDKKGNLWFGTQAQGVCRFDGKEFTWFTEKGLAGPAVLGLFEDSKGNLWFGNNGAGLFKYDGKSLVNFTEEKGLGNKDFRASGKSESGTLARVYSINEDNDGNLWIGTVDSGVWRYDGNHLTNYTTKDGLTSNAINTIYKDQKGELWFGTDAHGICQFNGKRFIPFTFK